MEQTLVLIKPDAYERGLTNDILNIYKEKGLIIKEMKTLKATKELASKHYFEHKDKPYFKELIAYITRSPIVALILEGENAIARVREINGSTNPLEAKDGTIRKLYAISKNENAVHASDSLDSAKREIDIWFN